MTLAVPTGMMQGYLRRKLLLFLLAYSLAAMLVWLWHGLKTEESRSSTRELGQEEQEGKDTTMDAAGGEVSPRSRGGQRRLGKDEDDPPLAQRLRQQLPPWCGRGARPATVPKIRLPRVKVF